jgi:hypothetical protein
LTFESEWAKITEDNIYNEQNIMLHFAEAIEEFSAVNKEELKNIIITELRVMSNDNMFKVMRKLNTLYVEYDLENHIEEHITKNGKWNIYSTDFKIFGLQQYILQLKIKGSQKFIWKNPNSGKREDIRRHLKKNIWHIMAWIGSRPIQISMRSTAVPD